MGIKLAVDGADLRRPRWTALLSQRLPEYFRAVRELVGAAVSSFHDKLAKELPKATLPSLLFVLSRDLTLTLTFTLILNAIPETVLNAVRSQATRTGQASRVKLGTTTEFHWTGVLAASSRSCPSGGPGAFLRNRRAMSSNSFHYVIAGQCHRTRSRTASLRRRWAMLSNSFNYVIAGQCHPTASITSSRGCRHSDARVRRE